MNLGNEDLDNSGDDAKIPSCKEIKAVHQPKRLLRGNKQIAQICLAHYPGKGAMTANLNVEVLM